MARLAVILRILRTDLLDMSFRCFARKLLGISYLYNNICIIHFISTRSRPLRQPDIGLQSFQYFFPAFTSSRLLFLLFLGRYVAMDVTYHFSYSWDVRLGVFGWMDFSFLVWRFSGARFWSRLGGFHLLEFMTKRARRGGISPFFLIRFLRREFYVILICLRHDLYF